MNKLFVILGLVALIGTMMMISNHEPVVVDLKMNSVQMYHEYLADLAAEVNAMKTSWKATTYSRWSNMDFNSLKRIMGVLETPDTEEFWAPTVSDVHNAIPATFNASAQWPQCASIGEIRDQANCGSCWSFGAAESMSDRWCIANNGTDNTRISMENLLTCCSSCGYGCNGGYPIMAWKWWVSKGLVSGDVYGNPEWCQPYFIPSCGLNCPGTEATAPACQKSCNSNYTGTVPYSQDFFFGQSAFNVAANVAAIQTQILTYGPVEGAFQVYEDFMNYQGGVYVHTTGQYLGGHAIKILGWGVEGGQAYWLCANSWSPAWGEDGFFKILRGVNECGIESGVVAGLAKTM